MCPSTQADQIIASYTDPDPWYWTKYYASPYVGCAYDCSYCFNLGGTVTIKPNACAKFRQEISQLPRDVITIGDYQPIERQKRYLRRMIKIAGEHRFPIHLVEKSTVILDDIDLLQAIARKSWLSVSISVTDPPEDAGGLSVFEGTAPISSERFEVMRRLSEAGVPTGLCLMPVIPFIGDRTSHIQRVLEATKQAGGHYVIWSVVRPPYPFEGLFFELLNRHYPEQAGKVGALVQSATGYLDYVAELAKTIQSACLEVGLLDHLPRPVDHFPRDVQLNKRVAGRLYMRAGRASNPDEGELWLQAARALDHFPENVGELYEREGWLGLARLRISARAARAIEAELLQFTASQSR